MTLDELIAYVAALIQSLLQSIGGGITNAISTIQQYVGQIAGTVGNAIESLISGIVPKITQVITTIVDSLKGLLDPIMQAVTNIVSDIRNTMRDLVDSIEQAFVSLWTKVQSVIQTIMHSVEDFIGEIKSGVQAMVEGALNYVKQFASDVADTVKAYVDQGLTWLKSIAQSVYDSVKSALVATVDYITRLWQQIVSAVQDQWAHLITAADSIISTINERINSMADAVEKGFGGLSKLLEGLSDEELKPLFEKIKGYLDTVVAIADPATYKAARAALEDAFAPGTLNIRSTQGLQRFWQSMMPTNNLGAGFATIVFGIMSTMGLWKGIVHANSEVLLQQYGKDHPWELIPIADAVAAYRRGNMSQADVLDNIRARGITPEDAVFIIKNSEEVPSLGDLLDMKLRGIIDAPTFVKALSTLGITGEWSGQLTQLAQEIPPLDDIIRMARRLVFDPNVVSRYQLLNDYQQEAESWAAKKGLSKEWMQNYWAAHWDVPSVNQGFELLQRGFISRDDLEFLMRDAGVAPFWREQLLNIAFHPFTRVDIRRMHKVGVLSDGELTKAYQNIGYTEENAKQLAQFTIKLNSKAGSNIDAELGKLTRASILGFYDSGLVTRDKAQQLLVSIGATPEAAALYIANEDLTKHVNERKTQAAQIIELAHVGEISKQEATTRLQQLGLTQIEIDKALTDLERALTRVSKIPSHADANHLLDAGLIDETEYQQILQANGFSARYASLFLQAQKGKPHGKTKS